MVFWVDTAASLEDKVVVAVEEEDISVSVGDTSVSVGDTVVS